MLIVTLSGDTGLRDVTPQPEQDYPTAARTAGLHQIHPHMLRHFAASNLASGTTRDELQALLGWSIPSSPTRTSTSATAAAARRLTDSLNG